MTSYEYLHEVEEVELQANPARPVHELLPMFRSLGFTLHDDVVSLDRRGRVPPWQCDSIVEVEVRSGGEEVYGFEDGEWDAIRLRYLFATLPADLIDRFIDVVFAVSHALSLPVHYRGAEVDEASLRRLFAEVQADLAAETGEEPGSQSLAILIHSTYPRR